MSLVVGFRQLKKNAEGGINNAGVEGDSSRSYPHVYPKSSKPSGALFRRSLRNFAPVHALIEAINEICARVGSSTVRNDAPIRKRRVGR
jgi:hypothetical protein